MKKNSLIAIGAVVIAILLFVVGCSIGKRGCGVSTVKTEIRYVLKTDTLPVTLPGQTKYVQGKEVIVIKSNPQKDSLLVQQQRKIDNTEKLLDYYRGQYEALASAGVGDVITGTPPEVQKSGEVMSNDSTVVVRWKVTVQGEMPDGTKEDPNPYFEIDAMQKQTIETVDASKPYSLGAGIGASLGTDGKGLDAIPMLYVRKNQTTWFGRYHIKGQAVELGVAKGFDFGKRKKD